MKIWIDLDNTPHVPFFRPMIEELRRRGHEVVVTARDAFQVCDLATQMGVAYKKVGRHHGKNPFWKVAGLGLRALQLLPFIIKERPAMGLSHGSRAQILLCNLLRIPTVMVMDYEFARTPWILKPRWEIVPEVLRHTSLQCKERERIRTYPGIKEDVYAPFFTPNKSIVKELGLNGGNVIVTVRPPANEAHYHNPESELFFERFMNRLCATTGTRAVLLPRNKAQKEQILSQHPEWFSNGKTVIPGKAVDGLNLLYHSDLVVSGGGTMNREAAALGVPVYSIFRGQIGAVDKQLQNEGRLTLIQAPEDIESKILVRSRKRNETEILREGSAALNAILSHIEDIGVLEGGMRRLQPKMALKSREALPV